jgi:uncharacterized membrane protein
VGEKSKVLLVGESWLSNSVHIKGFDHFAGATFETGEHYLRKAFDGLDGISLEHLPSQEATTSFPFEIKGLERYDTILFSDTGSNSLLLHPSVFVEGKCMPNRLKLLKEWVENGGGFGMCGGYMSFSGFGGAAKYYRRCVEDP